MDSQQLPRRSNCPPCRHYTERGSCKFGSKCRYDHPPRPSGGFSVQQVSTPSKPTNPSSAAFRQLVKSDSSGWGERQKRMFIQLAWNLAQDRDVATILSFMESRDRAGARVLQDLLTPPLISSSAKPEHKTTSLEEVVVPLLRLLTNDNLLSCTMQDLVTPILSVIAERLDSDSLATALTHAFAREHNERKLLSHYKTFEGSHWSPSSATENLLPIAVFALEILKRFTNRFSEKVKRIHGILKQGVEISMRDPSNGGHIQPLMKVIWQLSRKLDGINDTQEKSQGANQLMHRTRSPFTVKFKYEARLKEEYCIPPGEDHLEGPRHDNDFRDISRISIAPTAAEVFCDITPYLPSNRLNANVEDLDIEDQVDLHLQIHFRLLRCDLIDPICVGLKKFLDAGGVQSLKKMTSGLKKKNGAIQNGQDDINIHIYRNVTIGKITTTKNSGVVYEVEFDTMPNLMNVSKNKRREWWESSRRLQHGTLCCLWWDRCSIGHPHLIFGIVADQNPDSRESPRPKIGMGMTGEYYNGDLVDAALGIHSLASQEVVLIQAGPCFFAYEPILRALQKCEIPMPNCLLCPRPRSGRAVIPPPQYLQNGNPFFDLSFLQQDFPNQGCNRFLIFPSAINLLSPENFPKHTFTCSTSLDTAQIDAIQAALTQRVAVIQGPPGTGKTFVGIQIVRALVKNLRMKAALPIFCVCFTNHALDQFLEGLLDYGVEEIVRVGSKKMSPRLKPYSLRESIFRKESHSQYTLRTAQNQRLEELSLTIKSLQETIQMITKQDLTWNMAQNLINVDAPYFEDSLMQRCREDSSNIIQSWRTWLEEKTQGKKDERSRGVQELLWSQDAWSMSRQERRKLHDHWAQMLIEDNKHELQVSMENYEQAKRIMKGIQSDVNVKALKHAAVVGMTTTGAAMHQETIAALKPKVLVVEEAAEVLEAHILTSMSSATEHLILIGDHDQLRPKTDLYMLQEASQCGFNFDISLFERLVSQGQIPYTQLITQRRMRPQFSRLIRETVYPNLQDYPGVAAYPDVRGMVNNLFFVDHDNAETCQNDSKSKQNHFEARFCVLLARYLVQKGYSNKGDVTVITPYAGQLIALKRAAKEFNIKQAISDQDVELLRDLKEDEGTPHSHFQTEAAAQICSKQAPIVDTSLSNGIRMATIDNFQGEEARIIILSLTRNEKDGKIGFLGAKNRVNVLLSRAKEGMYIVGNAQSLRACSKSDMWGKVLNMLEETGNIGSALELRCTNPPGHITSVQHWQDFDSRVGDGECSHPCNYQRPCGHRCQRRCHSDDSRHLSQCLREVDVKLHCGHYMFQVPCHRAQHPETLQCQVEVTYSFDDCPDQHEHKTKCWNVDNIRCRKNSCPDLVNKTMPFCRHSVMVKCGDRDNDHCPHACQRQLSATCGHTCQGKCGDCIFLTEKKLGMSLKRGWTILAPELEAKMVHIPCSTKCGKTLLCGHECKETCHYSKGDCPNCEQPCTHNCAHTKGTCQNKCSQPCVPCTKPCVWTCPHQGPCKLPCSAPCNRLPCDMRCTLKLDCGCQCPCLCGEKCPSSDFCLNHCSDTVKTQTVDFITSETFDDLSEENVNNDPLIVLQCGHVFTMSTMDNHMELEDFYFKETSRGTSTWTAPKPVSNRIDSRKTCIQCRQLISGVLRYGRPINKTLLDQLELRFVKQCDAGLRECEEELDQSSKRLTDIEKGRLEQLRDLTFIKHLQKRIIEVAKKADQLATSSKRTPKVILQEKQEACLAKCLQIQESSTACETSLREFDTYGLPKPDLSRSCKTQLMVIKCEMAHLKIVTIEVKTEISKWMRAGVLGHVLAFINRRGQKAAYLRERIQEFNQLIGRVYVRCNHVVEIAQFSRSITSQVLGTKLKLKVIISHLEFLAATNVREAPAAHGRRKDQFENKRTVLKADLFVEALKTYNAGINSATTDQQEEELKQLHLILEKLKENGSRDQVLRTTMTALEHNDRVATETFGQGHIYTCPNGHIYIIRQCGRAMEMPTCPDCHAHIGGTDHSLALDNTMAHDVSDSLQIS